MEYIKTTKVEVAAIHDIKRSCFRKDVVEDVDIVQESLCNAYKRRDIAA